MNAGNHTFAITNKPCRFALFKRPDNSQEYRSIDRLLQTLEVQPDTFTSVRIVATMPTRPINPHNVNPSPGNENRFTVDQDLPFRGRQQTMQLNAKGSFKCGGWKPNRTPLNSQKPSFNRLT
eukprot:4630716-Amphidinium_carterae.1